jgi:hypothetical protein
VKPPDPLVLNQEQGFSVYLCLAHLHLAWAQPNGGGTNLRLHNCIEEAVRAKRRAGNTPDVPYFNIIICDAYQIFLEREFARKNHQHNSEFIPQVWS